MSQAALDQPTAPSILVLGIGMGACFTSVYDIALGDLAHDEAGSASGALSAVQQLATAIGSAVATTIAQPGTVAPGGAFRGGVSGREQVARPPSDSPSWTAATRRQSAVSP